MEMLRNWENNFLLKTKSAGQSKPDSSCSANVARQEKHVTKQNRFHVCSHFIVLKHLEYCYSLSLSLSLSRGSPQCQHLKILKMNAVGGGGLGGGGQGGPGGQGGGGRGGHGGQPPTKSSRQKRLDRIEELRQLLPQNHRRSSRRTQTRVDGNRETTRTDHSFCKHHNCVLAHSCQ